MISVISTRAVALVKSECGLGLGSITVYKFVFPTDPDGLTSTEEEVLFL